MKIYSGHIRVYLVVINKDGNMCRAFGYNKMMLFKPKNMRGWFTLPYYWKGVLKVKEWSKEDQLVYIPYTPLFIWR